MNPNSILNGFDKDTNQPSGILVQDVLTEALGQSAYCFKKPWQTYTGVISQNGTDAPVPTVDFDDTGNTTTWQRDSSPSTGGQYSLHFGTDVDTSLLRVYIGNSSPSTGAYGQVKVKAWAEAGAIIFISINEETGEYQDGGIQLLPFEIRIMPASYTQDSTVDAAGGDVPKKPTVL